MKSLKNIVIAGYPKSGNTWLARLVAELLGCPVSGFWGYNNHPEIAIEGDNRKSKYCVYKSHHQYNELSGNPDIYKIIYIVRDPRDIVVSGIHYFNLRSIKRVAAIEKYIIRSNSRILKLIDRALFITIRRSKKMTDIILNGDSDIGRWVELPWDEHVSGYLYSQNVMVVKYEDLLTEPIKISEKILEHIGAGDKKYDEVVEAVHNQSFEFKRKEYKKNGDRYNLRFMRKGNSCSWKSLLPDYLISDINNSLHDKLSFLGYECCDILNED